MSANAPKLNFLNGSVSNPITNNPEESLQDKVVKDLKERSKSLFIQLEEQREVYAQAKKDYSEAKDYEARMKRRSESYEEGTFMFDKYSNKYADSRIGTKAARKTSDIELSRLQSYTDSYVSAQSISIFLP